MAREFIQEKFFDHSRFTNTYYATLPPLEYFIANTLMRGDMSRVLWASDDMAFFRRFMTVGSDNGGDVSQIRPSNLELPFVNYWYNGSWEPDDREYAVQPMQMIRGQWQEGLPGYLRALAVMTTFSFTAFFGRDDDARLGYELLLWEQQPRGPVQFMTKLEWKGTEILVPVFFTIENMNFNPEFQESEWLKAQRILPFKFDIIARTYSIYMQAQETFDGYQREKAPFATGLINPDPEGLYISEEVILNFASAKGWGTLDEETATYIDYDLDTADEFTDAERASGVATPREITTDLVQGYFEAGTNIGVNRCEVDPETITQNGFTLTWQVRPADMDSFDHMKILVPGQNPVWISDPKQKEYEFGGLYPNSDYRVTVLFYSKSGGITDFHLDVQTAEDPTDPIKRPLKRRMGRLRGMEW